MVTGAATYGRPCKRPRFYGPGESLPLTAYDVGCTFEVHENTSFLSAEDGIGGGCDTGPTPNADNELGQMRARLDDKLKSKFEAIFEKYSRDFTGIGDEIDLHTGEILVDNGHLRGMEHERDAGTPSNDMLVPAKQKCERSLGSNAREHEELDDLDHSSIAPEDMEEDDMIFFCDSRFAKGNLATPRPHPILDIFSQQHLGLNPSPQAQHSYPSEYQTVGRIGQRASPHIAQYDSQPEENHPSIELAWRTPDIPLPTLGKRSILKSLLVNTGVERSPSPDEFSVWALSMPRGRRKRDGADVAAVSKGETTARERKVGLRGGVSTLIHRKSTKREDPSQPRRSMRIPLQKEVMLTENKVVFSPKVEAKSAWASTPYNQIAKGHSLKSNRYISATDLCSQTSQTDDHGTAYFESSVDDSAGSTEYAPMATSKTHLSNDNDDSVPPVSGSPQPRIFSAILTFKNHLSNVLRKSPSTPPGGLIIGLQPLSSPPSNVGSPGADSSAGTDLGPSYSFSDDGEDDNYTEVQPTNLETFRSDETSSQMKAFAGQSSARQEPAGYEPPCQARVSENKHTVEQKPPCSENSVQLKMIEESSSVQKKRIKAEPLILVEVNDVRPFVDVGVMDEPVLASFEGPSVHTSHEMRLSLEKSYSPSGTSRGKLGDDKEIYDQHVSLDLQGLGAQALSSQKKTSADRSPNVIKIDDAKDQRTVDTSLPKMAYSTSIEATENNSYYAPGETSASEAQRCDNSPHQSLMFNGPVLRKLPRPTRPSSVLPGTSSYQLEQFQLRGINSAKIPGSRISHSKPYRQTLSGILGFDEFGELQRHPESLVGQALRGAICGRVKGKPKLITSIAIDSTKMKKKKLLKSVRSTMRRTHGDGSIGSARTGMVSPVFGQPNNTVRQCGQKGFKCTKEFCFRCIGD